MYWEVSKSGSGNYFVIRKDMKIVAYCDGPLETLLCGISVGLGLGTNDGDTNAPWEEFDDAWQLKLEQRGEHLVAV